jgi:ABC-2 type transport system permease protein
MSRPDRGAWRLVAMRDFWVRLRERSFLISTVINMTVISVLVLARAAGGGGGEPSFDLGVVGGASVVAIADRAAALGDEGGVTIRVVPIEASLADEVLADGSVDAVLSEGRLVGNETIDSTLEALVQTSAHDEAVDAVFGRHDVPQAERDAANERAPLDTGVLHAAPPNRSENAGIAFLGVLLLYGQLFGYGLWVATGVIEEKASRVVEMLLSAIRPRQLLAGKIIGIGALGLCQLAVIAGFAITLAAVTHAQPVSSSALWAAGLVIGWFVLGFSFYASLFAAAGSLVSRMEELQNVIVPINLTILISFFISIGALQHPDAPISVVASILPVSAALAMPVRIVLGAATPSQIALALVLLIGSTIALVPVGARLYEGAVLRTGGRVRLRDAWGAGDRAGAGRAGR